MANMVVTLLSGQQHNEYKGIILSYGVNSSDRVYWDSDLCGGQLNTIQDDGKVTMKQIFKSYEGLE